MIKSREIHAVEFNWISSMIDYIADNIYKYADEYNLHNIKLNILPAYPKDLTRAYKPSIIIQKISTISRSVGMGNVLGYTEDEYGQLDVYGRVHKFLAQVDVIGRTREQTALLSSLLAEKILVNPALFVDPNEFIPLKDYTSSITPCVGHIKIFPDIDIMNTTPEIEEHNISISDDYKDIIRFQSEIIQPIIPTQDMVDLSKPIKWFPKIVHKFNGRRRK